MTAERPAPPGWDLPLSIVLLVLLAIGALLFAGVALLSGLYAEACGSNDVVCNWTGFDWGLTLGSYGQAVVVIGAIAGTVVLRLRRRRGFWAPLAGIVAAILVLVTGLGLVAWSIPGTVL